MDHSRGYAKILRSVQVHWIYDNPLYFRAWIDLILTATHKEVVRGGITLKEGEVAISQCVMCQRWGMTRQATRTFLNKLKSNQMVILNPTNKLTKITLIQYVEAQSVTSRKKPRVTNPVTIKQPTNNQRTTSLI
jgi:hypothetical protein